MRRALSAAVLLFLTSTASAEELERYLVGTRAGFGDREVRALVRDAEASTGIVSRRPAARFHSVDGFAADLTEQEVARLRRTPGVRFVEPVVERYALAVPKGQVIPYGIDAIHTREVWSSGRGRGTNVVVVDTGVDYRHSELKDIWAGGYNTYTDKNDPVDDNGHGTHVAGTIAAADNALGVVGVAPEVRLWGAKVLNAEGSGTDENLIEAIDWVIAKKKELGGNWVVNLSLGSARPSLLEKEAFARVVDAGIVVAAASGNESLPTKAAPVSYPAAYPGVIAVGAVGENHRIASFSNQGPEVGVVAPGIGVLSTVPVGTGSIAYATAGTDEFDAAVITGAAKGVVTGEYVYCGIGRPQDFPTTVRGRIALIRRGELKFYEKAYNARQAGATAVIIFNHDDALPLTNWTVIPTDAPDLANFEWPVAIALGRADGERLAKGSGVITAANDYYDYDTLNGTSMATPHVAGAAALIWSLAPTARAEDVVSALLDTAVDLGAGGRDAIYGFGLIDAAAAARKLAPSGASPAKPADTPPTTGRPAGLRRRP